MILNETNLNSKFIVDINDFKIVKQIESDSFGSSYSVENNKTKKLSIAKVVLSKNVEIKKMVNQEIEIMINYHHPVFIKYIGYSLTDFYNDNNVTFFIENFDHGSLEDFFQQFREKLIKDHYDNTNRQILLIGIAYGMMILHENNISARGR